MFFLVREIGHVNFYAFHTLTIILSAIDILGSSFYMSPKSPEVIRPHYKLHGTLFLAATFILASSIISISRRLAPDDYNVLPGLIAGHFFEIGFPGLAFSALVEILRLAALPRVQYHSVEKRKIALNLMYVVDTFALGYLLGGMISAIQLGVGCETVLDFLLMQHVQADYAIIAFWVFLMIQLILSRNDIRPLSPWIWAPVFFLTCVVVGTVVIVARAPMPPADNFSQWMIKVVLIKLCGCLAMTSILGCFPKLWLPRILHAYQNVQPPGVEEETEIMVLPPRDPNAVLPIASSFERGEEDMPHYLLPVPKRNGAAA